MQLELHEHEALARYWKQLGKREAKAAAVQGDSFVPPHQRPEATYLPTLVQNFLEVSLGQADPAAEGIIEKHMQEECMEEFMHS